MDKRVARVALEYLRKQTGIAGVAWKKISEEGMKGGKDLSLKCLTDWSNIVHVAIQSFGSSDGEVAVVDDSWERRIVIAFKKYFKADYWPSIQCLHWLMPLGMPSISSLCHLPVNPDGKECSTEEVQRMIRVSSNRI